jgi:hypothetical protein
LWAGGALSLQEGSAHCLAFLAACDPVTGVVQSQWSLGPHSPGSIADIATNPLGGLVLAGYTSNPNLQPLATSLVSTEPVVSHATQTGIVGAHPLDAETGSSTIADLGMVYMTGEASALAGWLWLPGT